MFDLQSYLNLNRQKIDKLLDSALDAISNTGRIVDAMRYSLLAGGKRIRPILCIAAAESIGPVADDVFTAACAIEMIHTYSLIHDDLPSMDNDQLRRGKPTCHVAFDEATAILAGDALLTMAFEMLSSKYTVKNCNHIKWLNVINLIANAAGHNGMIEGQMRDIASEGNKLDLNELENMHRLKTGKLINASVITGAILSGGNNQQIECLKNYAENIGLAFQISDDILNVKGDPAVMGKQTGTDNNRNKNTYPSLLSIEESRNLSERLIMNALKALDAFDNKSDPLRHIANYIIIRDK